MDAAFMLLEGTRPDNMIAAFTLCGPVLGMPT
jgi:hypothetical protein